MRHLKLITAAIMAIAAFSALTATTAFGAQAEGFLPLANFVGSGLEGKLETLGGNLITCNKFKVTAGKMETDSHGKATITYEKCAAVFFGLKFAANSLGDAAETILAPSLYLLCLINSATLEYGIFIEPTPAVHLETGGKLFKIEGGVIGKIKENKKSLKKTLEFKATKGDSEPKTCTGVDGVVKTANQTTTQDEGKAESSGLTGSGTIEAEDKKTETEIMDGI